ncbi:MAG: thermonuclease family protein [Kiritimatiellae bacterium]|nr:thermonuclease family protein [Kiritimatiellia bacterium]
MEKWNNYCNKCAVLAVAVIAAWVAGAATLEGKVTRVADGDTIRVTDGERRYQVRLERIDAPELRQDYGYEATVYLDKRIGGKTVKVEWQKKDPYGRILGIVYLDGVDINLEMVATGNAWHYAHFDNTPEYAEAEKSARAARLGLWSGESPISPYDFRRGRFPEGKAPPKDSGVIAIKMVDGKPVVFDPATGKPIPLLPAEK